MNAQENNDRGLSRRLGDLEAEVRRLKERMGRLEQTAHLSAPTVDTPPEVVKPPPPPSFAAETQPSSVPPPLPETVRRSGPAPVREPGVRRPSAVGEFLRAVHLLPPADESRGEVQLGWWATRIGALLFVLGVVFFGVYLSIDTPPWVKLAELAAASLGVAVGGWWLEKKVPRVGAVILGAGLALIYFTAFAAYAVPAVKVFDHMGMAGALQALVITAIYIIAIKRRSQTVATMATTLGFFAAWFSHAAGFNDFALGASLILLGAAAVFRCRERWPGPLALAVVLYNVMLAWIAVTAWTVAPEAVNWAAAFGVLAVGFAVCFGASVWEGAEPNGRLATAQRWIQIVNTTCASLAGFIVARALLADADLARYFFPAAGVLAAAAWRARRAAPRDGLFSVLAVHAAALLALGVATEWGARTRWIALVIEAFVILAAARRTGRRSLHITAVVAWLVALGFFSADLPKLDPRPFSAHGAAAGFFVVAGVTLLALVRRWAFKAPDKSGRAITVVLGVAAAVSAWLAGERYLEDAWAPAALLLVGMALVAVAALVRNPVSLPAGGVAFAFGHFALHFVQGTSATLSSAVWNGLLVACGTFAAAWRLGRRVKEDDAVESARHVWAVLALTAIGVAALYPTAYLAAPARQALAFTMLLGAVTGCGGRWRENAAVLGAGCAALALAALLNPWYRGGTMAMPGNGSLVWLWLAAATAPGLLVALGGDSSARAQLNGRGLFQPLALLTVAVGGFAGWIAASSSWSEVGLVWSLIGLALAYASIGVARNIGFGLAGASGFLGLAAAVVAMVGSWPDPGSTGVLLPTGAATVLAIAVLPLAAARIAPWINRSTLIPWRVVHAIVAALVGISLAVQPGVPWLSYGSVVWALAGILVFVLGLYFRARSHRIVGLATLALCIPRVFVVDLESAFTRIAAFVVLGGVLLSVGFSYQRFRHLIVDDGPGEKHE